MKCFHYLCLVKAGHSIAYSLGNGIRTNGFESFWAILNGARIVPTTCRSSIC